MILRIFSTIGVGCGIIVLTLLMSELIGLGTLIYSNTSFPKYWQGRAKQDGELLYIAIGDSAAVGLGASQAANGYVGLIAANIEASTGRSVRIINLAVSGATIQDALRDQLPQLKQYDPDLVTVEIGANDMKSYRAITFRKQLESLMQALPPGKSTVSTIPVFGMRQRSSDQAAQAANIIIQELGDKYRIPIAPLYQTLLPHQSVKIYASDFFHPNNRGYRLWAEAFKKTVPGIVGTRIFTEDF